jgi:hypothetical protein
VARCDCGADSSRTRTTFPASGTKTVCPTCEPSEFAEAFIAPSDNKIWLGPEVYPTLYKRDAEGKYHAKDELIADTVAIMQSDPDAEAVAKWRAMRERTRRVSPMTEAEIKAAETGPLANALRDALEEQRKEALWQKSVDDAAREAAASSEHQ